MKLFIILLLSIIFLYSNARPLDERDSNGGENNRSKRQEPGGYFNTGWNWPELNNFMHAFTKSVNYSMKNGK
jgi:hypothetical protein